MTKEKRKLRFEIVPYRNTENVRTVRCTKCAFSHEIDFLREEITDEKIEAKATELIEGHNCLEEGNKAADDLICAELDALRQFQNRGSVAALDMRKMFRAGMEYAKLQNDNFLDNEETKHDFCGQVSRALSEVRKEAENYYESLMILLRPEKKKIVKAEKDKDGNLIPMHDGRVPLASLSHKVKDQDNVTPIKRD